MGLETPLRVGIGLVRRGEFFLVRQRPPGSALAGYWEFPGGKLEPGETAEQTTSRECREELGLAVVVTGLRRKADHSYAHGPVELSFFDCELSDPTAEPDRATGFRWVAVSELASLRFPEANSTVIADLIQEQR